MSINCYYSKFEGHFKLQMKMAIIEESELIRLPLRSQFTALDNIYIENPKVQTESTAEINHCLPQTII